MNAVTIGNAMLYLGDCREILPSLAPRAAIITDPVWPNAPASAMPGSERPEALFAEMVAALPDPARIVVQLGCDSNPRMLAAVGLPFLRLCSLEYACPTYKGRLLHTGDAAYCYGEWPPPRRGAMLLPGKCISGRIDHEFTRGLRQRGKEKGGWQQLPHPMPRRLELVSWLVGWWSAPTETVIDPFLGSGTTGVACARLGRSFVGIEIVPRWFDVACQRIEQAQRQGAFLFSETAE